MKSKILLVIRALVTFILLAVLMYMVRDSIPKMIGAIRRLPLSVAICGLSLFSLSALIISIRLKILLATQKIFVSVVNITRLTFMGYFFSSFLPTSIGGDVVKAFYISKLSDRPMQSYTTVFMDRFIGMATIFLVATGALLCTKEVPKSYFSWVLPLLLIVSATLLLLMFNRNLAKKLSLILPAKIKGKFKDIYEAVYNFANHKPQVLQCVFISMAGQIVAFSIAYIFVRGLGAYVPLKFVLIAMPIASVASMVPSIYGTGPREMAMVFVFSPFIGKDKALAVAFLWLGLLLAVALIGAIIYAFMGRYKIRTSDVAG